MLSTMLCAAALAAASSLTAMQPDVAHPNGPIVLLGASYAGGWDLANVAGIPVINKGVSGEQAADLLARFERDVIAARPRAVIIWGFINDITRAENPEQAIPRVKESYRQMIERARAHRIEVILATEVTISPPPTWTETLASWVGAVMGKEAYQDRVNAHVMAGNTFVVDTARRERFLLLDLQSALAGKGHRRRPEFTQDDGSHITPAGYAALTAYAKPILEAHFRGRDSER